MDLGAFFRNFSYVKQMTNITNEVLDTERWRACVDEARKRLDACTVHEKNGGAIARAVFEFNQIYGLCAARMYDQGWGRTDG